MACGKQDVYWRHFRVQSVLCPCSQADRRNLDSASSEHVASELKQLVERFLPVTAISTSDNSYACRPCFKRIEKLLKLRKATEDIEKEVIVNLMHAAHLYEAPHRKEEEEGGSSSTPRISRRRSSLQSRHVLKESPTSGEFACVSSADSFRTP